VSRKQRKLQERLSREGTFARGEITALKRHKLQNARDTYTWDVTARFWTAEGAPVESTQTLDFLVWSSPTVGKPATLRYDPQEPALWVWEDDPPDLDGTLAQSVQVVDASGADPAQVQAQLAAVRDKGLLTQQQYEQALSQLPGATAPTDGVESRLDRLKRLKDEGAIDDAEYAEQRRRILESL
jgi:hypothetical protein